MKKLKTSAAIACGIMGAAYGAIAIAYCAKGLPTDHATEMCILFMIASRVWSEK
jgi:hypothetical protein